MTQQRPTLPIGLLPYKQTVVFDETTIPSGLRHRHRTKPGVWGLIRIIDGRLRYRLIDIGRESILDPEHPGIVRPAQWHAVEPLGPVRFSSNFTGLTLHSMPALNAPTIDTC